MLIYLSLDAKRGVHSSDVCERYTLVAQILQYELSQVDTLHCYSQKKKFRFRHSHLILQLEV
jgi:hypothetical protein